MMENINTFQPNVHSENWDSSSTLTNFEMAQEQPFSEYSEFSLGDLSNGEKMGELLYLTQLQGPWRM
jgi:hypothetical protein